MVLVQALEFVLMLLLATVIVIVHAQIALANVIVIAPVNAGIILNVYVIAQHTIAIVVKF
jgi:hypothetical protein